MTLEALVKEGEVIATYATTDDFWNSYHCIIDSESDDIGSALEDTLHRILDAGGTEEDVKEITNFMIPSEQEREELEATGEFTDIDLGYVLPGLLVQFLKD